jgi:hypothetical protein
MAFIKYTSGPVNIIKENVCCTCDSDEHQINFRYFEEEDLDNLVYVSIHLKPESNVFKRFLKSVKYFFGYTSKFGNFDEVILDKEKCNRIINFLERGCK